MNTYNQIVYNPAMMNNYVWTAFALSQCNNKPHRTTSGEGDVFICGAVFLTLILTFIATYIIIKK